MLSLCMFAIVAPSSFLWINQALHNLAACCPLFNILRVLLNLVLCDLTEQFWVFFFFTFGPLVLQWYDMQDTDTDTGGTVTWHAAWATAFNCSVVSCVSIPAAYILMQIPQSRDD